jgi:hypothetical protein
MYIQPVSGREVLHKLLRLLLVGGIISTGIFFTLRQVALQAIVVAERQLAQQDEEAREAAWEQLKAYEVEFAQANAPDVENVKEKQQHIARLYKRLWEREVQWGNPRLCGESPMIMTMQTEHTKIQTKPN